MAAAEELLAPFKLAGFTLDYGIHLGRADAELFEHPLIEHHHAIAGDGSHRILLMAGHAEFAYHQHVEGAVQ